MKRQYLICVGLMCILLGLVGCSNAKSNQKPLRDKAAASGLIENHNKKLDLSYYSPSKSLKQYSAVYIEPLNFSEVKIIRSSSRSQLETPWELNDKDKAFYQEKFSTAAASNFAKSDVLKIVDQKTDSDLVLRAKIVEIAPLGPKDDFLGRPQQMKVYTQGFGTMTIVFEFYDAKTNDLVAAQLDEHELGIIWEENNRIQNNFQIRLAFEYWMSTLVKELAIQTKS